MRSTRVSLFCGLFFALSCLPASAQNPTQDSPFKPAPGNPETPSGPKERWELVGISVVGPKTSVCLFDTEKSLNRWLVVGEKSSGLEIVSCDPKTDTAVVRVGGQSKTLTLRKASVSAAVPVLPVLPSATGPEATAAAAPASAPAETGPMTEQQVQEREARMLVSDLLEIGMQQRKAYEEKKAAEDAAKKAPSPTPAPAAQK